jgi:hypothetical protein
MSITDELRKYANGYETLVNHKLLAIADRIDAEHERQLEVLYRDMSDAEYVKLPKDADGEYIHVGDKVICGVSVWTVTGLELVGDRWSVRCTIYNESGGSGTASYSPIDLRHYHAPTVEDVLREFGDWYAHTKGGCDEDGIIAEYAAKLRLKEDA